MIKRSDFAGIFENKTVLVTGHTGFKGAWLALWLQELGAKVIGFSLPPPTNPSLFEALELEKRIIHLIGDIRDSESLSARMAEYQPDVVFHLAAQPLVLRSYHEPAMTFETNVMGTLHLFEAIRAAGSVRVCVNITSDKCYENREWVYAYRENDPVGGHDPYSASKGAAELVTSCYRNSYFHPDKLGSHRLSVSSVRAGNVIGGGDWAENRIVPDCMRALVSKQDIKVRNPNAVRPWQHVFEPLSGYLWLAAKMWTNPQKFSDAWNFGPTNSENVPVRDVVMAILDLWGNGNWVDCSSTTSPYPHEAHFLKLDCTKSTTLLGWRPVYSFAEAVAETVAWYRRYAAKDSKIHEFSLSQIHGYANKARESNIPWAVGTQ